MQIEVDMSYEQYFEVNRLLLLKGTASQRWNFVVMYYLIPAAGIVFGAFALYCWTQVPQFSNEVWIFFSGVSVFFLWGRFRFPAKVRKVYEKIAGNLPGDMSLTTAGVQFERRNGTASINHAWNAFEGWLERPDMFLLFAPGNSGFVRIPKDKLTGAEQDEVRGWISAGSKQVT